MTNNSSLTIDIDNMTVLVSNADVNVATYRIQTYLSSIATDLGFKIKIKVNEEKSVCIE